MVFIGAPGVGKGTYASRLARAWQVPHISVGDVVRETLEHGDNDLARRMAPYVRRGELVPSDLIDELVQRTLRARGDAGFILDGYPRTLEQARQLDRVTCIDSALVLTLPREVLLTKLTARRYCRRCGRTFNFANIRQHGLHMPPLLPPYCRYADEPRPCDCRRDAQGTPLDCAALREHCTFVERCDGVLSVREDDTESIVRHRLEVYEREHEPIERYYASRGRLRRFALTGGVQEMLPKLQGVMLRM